MSAKIFTSTIPKIDSDRIYEGLRIPASLENTTSVSFVLTQEPGKLKPKDLKIAIEKNRAQRELRAAEQKKIRDEGGGAGLLDLRSILSEERLNLIDGDPFKRQLREMAFLQDVDDVQKMEIEKGFRVSEDYVGSDFLTPDEIQMVYKQRAEAKLLKRKADWRNIQSRQKTETFLPTHTYVKAGASVVVAEKIVSTLTPHFDPNRNDIWAKRLNTLRRFISLVSRWLIRKRVTDRIRTMREVFANNGASSREEVLAFIDQENSAYRKSGGKNTLVKATPSGSALTRNTRNSFSTESKIESVSQQGQQQQSVDPAAPASVAVMVFSASNDMQLTREYDESVLLKSTAGEIADLSPQMIRRILFPKCSPQGSGGSGSRRAIPPSDLRKTLLQFNDKTFFQLKVRPEFVTLGYGTAASPPTPVFYPPCMDKDLRVGAPEETFLRSAADAKITSADLSKLQADSPEDASVPQILKDLRRRVETAVSPNDVAGNETAPSPEGSLVTPQWLNGDAAEWKTSERDFFQVLPEYRVLVRAPRRCELDADWILRPNLSAQSLVYKPDTSLRTSWLSQPGFLSANVYLLGSQESRNRDAAPAVPGPTLSNVYNPDSDRHASGLSCYSSDHLRGLLEKDGDVGALQTHQAKQDCLTDSESDNEDGYSGPDRKPSMARVRKILSAPPPPPPREEPAQPVKGGKAAPPAKAPAKGAAAPAAPPKIETAASIPIPSPEEDAFSPLKEGQRREEQVELLRDRKMLELESSLGTLRKKQENEIADRMVEIAKKSQCALLALPVQMPFHRYEEEVYQLVESRSPPPVSMVYVEPDPRQQMNNTSVSNLPESYLLSPSGNSTIFAPFSPPKKS